MTIPSQVTSYKKLQLYQKARLLVLKTYQITSLYPKSELYSLVTQMRRSAMSVLANIVEGYSKESAPEYARFLTISIGSITELEVYLDISLDLGYLSKDKLDKMNTIIIEVKRLLYGSRKRAREKISIK